jgi:transcriptional regulator of arginine metabolism
LNATGKLARQRLILGSIESEAVRTQSDLAELLRQKGCVVSQPTLSKDIAELGLVKAPATDGGYRYQATLSAASERQGHRLRPALREFLLEWTAAGQLVVLKTVAGHAAGLAWALDEVEWPEIVGTVAGEDTVLVVAPDQSASVEVMKRIDEAMNE